ncbi:arginine decarboxylase, partial [Salmonella enterica subsp. enterica serovar Mississippi]|nr:arginine decarboxylase [Salmonella enterica subsp. enterica serovar Mississippi]
MCDKKYLIVGNSTVTNLPLEEAIEKIVTSLTSKGEQVQFAHSYENATTYVTSTAAVDCVMAEWVPSESAEIIDFLKQLRLRHEKAPVFLLVSSHGDNKAVTAEVM